MTREIRRSPPISGHTRTFAGSTRVLMKTSCAGSLTLLFLTAAAPEIRAQVRFVDATAGGANTGTSWTDAFVDLHGAMLTVPAGTELWVRGGTYLASGTGDQAASFRLRSGVAVYGGFVGNESARWQRDVDANPTVLHGDLGGNDQQGSGPNWWLTTAGYADNTFRVVVADGADATALLDGFTITHGRAVYTATYPWSAGGGLAVANGSPRIHRCTFRHCFSYWSGAAVAVQGGSPEFRNCSFSENMVLDGRGGAMAIDSGASANILDCTFRWNTVRSSQQAVGGAINIFTGGTAIIDGCSFVGNQSRNLSPAGQFSGAIGGAVYNGTSGTQIRRCRFVDNVANAGGGIFSYAALTVTDCEFDDNDVVSYDAGGGTSFGGFGGGLAGIALGPQAATIELIHCTFVNGNASDDGGGAYLASSTTSVIDCVFWNNGDSLGQIGRSQCRGAKPRFSCVQNLWVAAADSEPGKKMMDSFALVEKPMPHEEVMADYERLKTVLIPRIVALGMKPE